MSFLLLSFAIVVAFVAVVLKRRRGAIACASGAVLLVLVVGQGWAPRWLLSSLQDAPPLAPAWKSRNAIVVLGAGTVAWPEAPRVSSGAFAYSRLHECARLYRDCKSAERICTVLVAGGDPLGNGESEAAVMKRELVEIGVSAADVQLEDKSRTTFENARFASKTLLEGGFDQIALVTSGFHLKRSLAYFARFGVAAAGAPADRFEASITAWPTAQSFLLADVALHEYAGFLRAFVYDAMGWNAR